VSVTEILQQLAPWPSSHVAASLASADNGQPQENERKASACKMRQPYPSFSDFRLPLMQGARMPSHGKLAEERLPP
jgi:hypothetical protein